MTATCEAGELGVVGGWGMGSWGSWDTKSWVGVGAESAELGGGAGSEGKTGNLEIEFRGLDSWGSAPYPTLPAATTHTLLSGLCVGLYI